MTNSWGLVNLSFSLALPVWLLPDHGLGMEPMDSILTEGGRKREYPTLSPRPYSRGKEGIKLAEESLALSSYLIEKLLYLLYLSIFLFSKTLFIYLTVRDIAREEHKQGE